MVTVAATDLNNKLDQIIAHARCEPILVKSHERNMVVILDYAEYERLQESHLMNCGETLSPSIAWLRSMAGMFNSGVTDTSEQVKALVTDFIL